MGNRFAWAAVSAAVLSCAGGANAREPAASEEREPAAVVELGAVGEWGVQRHGGSAYGPSVSAEITPIPETLAVELGVAPLFEHGRADWGTELLFKKPFTLTKHLEFLAGAGPKWEHSSERDGAAVEALAELMLWPGERHRFGWYLAPSYSYSFSAGHDQALGLHTGLLIAVP